jgi:hypothetical protein
MKHRIIGRDIAGGNLAIFFSNMTYKNIGSKQISNVRSTPNALTRVTLSLPFFKHHEKKT